MFNLNKRQNLILDFIDEDKEVSTSEILKMLKSKKEKVSRITVIRDLSFLVKNNFLEKNGAGRNVKYCLSRNKTKKHKPIKISKEMQTRELVKRVPPILNVDVVVFKEDATSDDRIIKFLIGHRNLKKNTSGEKWLFPGSRMKYTETPQETAERVLRKEVPGIKAHLKKLAGVIADKGYDSRAYGVTIYFLYQYISGKAKLNEDLDDFKWLSSDEINEMEGARDLSKSILLEMDAAVRSMNTSEDELIVEVDKNNKEIGVAIKRLLHSDNTRFHRAAHIMIFNSKGEVVAQKRSINKSSGAGMWDMHGGHQTAGMTIEQTARQELAEELGIETKLHFHKVGFYKTEKQAEFAHIYWGVSDGPYGFDKNEVSAIKTFDPEKLLKGGYNKKYKFVEPFIKEYTQELKNVWMKLKKKNSSKK